MNVRLSKDARDFLKRREPKHAKQIAVKIQELSMNPEPPDSKLLKENPEGYRRADAGEYRIIYQVSEDILDIVLIGKRNDGEVYGRFSRMRRKLK